MEATNDEGNDKADDESDRNRDRGLKIYTAIAKSHFGTADSIATN